MESSGRNLYACRRFSHGLAMRGGKTSSDPVRLHGSLLVGQDEEPAARPGATERRLNRASRSSG